MQILTPSDLARCDLRDVEEIASGRDFVVAVVAGETSGYALAAALHSDWLALDERAILAFGQRADRGGRGWHAAWSGAIWRIGHRALRLCLLSGMRFTAGDAVRDGLADAVATTGEDPLKWICDWIGGRSTAALHSAAALIRRRGGDTLERAEFARLFATGEPQEGLDAFLAKRRPAFGATKPEKR